jgi:aquaglyceroporin related protein, other eukaryote
MSDITKESTMSQPAQNNHLHGEMIEKRRTSVFGQLAHAEHGPLIDHKIPQADAVQAEPDLLWSRIRRTMREPFSEFFGVFILILFGDGVVAQVVLSKGTKGDYQSISWGWG